MALKRKLTVPAGAPGRVDRFLAAQLGVSRARLKEIFAAGRVRVGGRRVRKGDDVAEGMEVEIEEDEVPAIVSDPSLALQVLHEDASVLVLDKPAGVPTHPLKPGESGTLGNALIARFPECVSASVEARECGLVHRLDTGTSGVVIAARNRGAFEALRRSFQQRQVRKLYVALVAGAVGESGEVDMPIANDPRDRKKVVACGSQTEAERLGAEEALTRYRLRDRYGALQLLDVEIVTGVRHQIRVHLAAIGAPVAGDALYGAPPLAGLSRPFLHAARVEFRHPDSGQPLVVESPLPADLVGALESLRTGAR